MINIPSTLSNIITGVREKIPIGMIWVYDTTNTVPYVGPYVRYYSGINPALSGALKRTQFESDIFNDWTNGLPVALSDYVGVRANSSGIVSSDPFTVIYSGFFDVQTSGDYTFSLKLAGAADLTIDGSSVITGAYAISSVGSGCAPGSISAMYVTGFYDGKPMFWSGVRNLSTGCHEYILTYKWDRSQLSGVKVPGPYLAAYYAQSGNDPKVVSASVLNYQCGAIQPNVITDFIYIDQNTDSSLSTVCSFEVPLTTSGSYSWSQSNQEFGFIKPNRLVKIFMGYATQSGYDLTSGYTTNLDQTTDMVQKFTGFIDSARMNHGADNSVLVVECRDFSKKLLNGLNENYPNNVSYSSKVLGKIDPQRIFDIQNLNPMAWDRWDIKDMIETLALHGGIDPANINKSKWDVQNHFVMESNLNWPSTSTFDENGVETKDADPYTFQFEYGEKLYDEVKKVADLIGYNVYFDEVGDLVFKEPRSTNSVEVYETNGYGSDAVSWDGWSLGLDINAYNRLYVDSLTSGTPTTSGFYFYFSGVGCGIRYTQQVAGSDYTTVITRDSDSAVVFSGNYASTGVLDYNVSREFTRDLAITNYTARITATGSLRIEGLEYYTDNIFKPVRTLYDSVDISDVSLDFTDSNLRNEVIAVGQQIGDKSYLYSKAIDLDSIYNPSAFNYVGDKRTFVLIEPTIQSQQRLDWMSSALLERYRRNSRNITVRAQGLPEVQVNDPIGLRISKLGLDSDNVSGFDSNNEEIYYVTQMNSRLSRASYTTNVVLTTLKPIESWRPSISITDDVLSLIFSQNGNTIFSDFNQNTLNSAFGYGYDSNLEQAVFASFNLWVDVDRLWVLIADDETADIAAGLNGAGNIIKSINPKDKTATIEYTTLTDPQGTIFRNPKGGVWLHNGGGERWGNITVPTANNAFNDGMWIGQRSDSTGRKNGVYPIAIWAQFRSIDGSLYTQGIWVPPTGELPAENIASGFITTPSGDNIYYRYSTQAQADLDVINTASATSQLVRLPGIRVKNGPIMVDMWCGPKESGIKMVENSRLVDMSCDFDIAGYWNLPQPSYGDPQDFWGLQRSPRIFWTGINRLELTESISGLPHLYMAADDGPYRNGDYVINEGHMTGDDFYWCLENYTQGYIRYTTNFGRTVQNYFDRFDVMQTSGAQAKAFFGWTPMACDLLTGVPLSNVIMTGATAGPALSTSFGYQQDTSSSVFIETFANKYNGTLTAVSGIFSTSNIQSMVLRAAIYTTGNTLVGQSNTRTVVGSTPTGVEFTFSSGITIVSGSSFRIAVIATGATNYRAYLTNSTQFSNGQTTSIAAASGTNFTPSLGGFSAAGRTGWNIKYNETTTTTGYNIWPGAPYTKNKFTYNTFINAGAERAYHSAYPSGAFLGTAGFANGTGGRKFGTSWGFHKTDPLINDSGSFNPDGRSITAISPFHDLNYYTLKFNVPVKYVRVNAWEFDLGPLDFSWFEGGSVSCTTFPQFNCTVVGNVWHDKALLWWHIGGADLGATVIQETALWLSNAAERRDMFNVTKRPAGGGSYQPYTIYSQEFQSSIGGPGASGVVQYNIPSSSYIQPSMVPQGIGRYNAFPSDYGGNVSGPQLKNVLIHIEFMHATTGQYFYTVMRGWSNQVGRITFNPWAHSRLL